MEKEQMLGRPEGQPVSLHADRFGGPSRLVLGD